MGKLTVAKVKALTAPGRYGDGGGLWLQVRDAEHRSWLFRYTRFGQARQLGLGPLSQVSLAEARDAALTAQKMLRDGKDPIEVKREIAAAERLKAAAHTFKQVTDLYIAAHTAGWKNEKHKGQWRATMDTYVIPVFGKRPVAAVQTGDVMKVLEPMWREKPETAARVRGRIESVLDYATARGWRTGDNPARWRGHIANLLPARSKVAIVQHHPALPAADVATFLTDLRKEVGAAARALELVILTAVRTNEALGALWPEVDLAGKVWTVPAERMKAGKEHRVPLSAAAVAVLKDMQERKAAEGPDYVFPGARKGKPLSNMALLMVLRRMKRTDITAHGFRSTFRDWAAESTDFPREVAEAALAHTLKDKVEAAYRRGDLFTKRAELMTAWATFCEPQNDQATSVA